MLRDSTKKKEADDLARALAEKPATTEPAFMSARRRPKPDEVDQTPVREIMAKQTEALKAEVAEGYHKGQTGATAEASEAAMRETVRRLKVEIAKKGNVYDVAAMANREAQAHADNLALIRAELAQSIHTEDYS